MVWDQSISSDSEIQHQDLSCNPSSDLARAMPGARIDLYYDIVSPYTFIGFELLCRYRAAWNLDRVEFKPVLLGAVLSGAGTKLPKGGISPAKAAYSVKKDIPRLIRHYGLPMRQDLDSPRLRELMFQRGTLQTMRYLTAVQINHPEAVEPLSRELFIRLFTRHQDVTEPTSLLEAAQKTGLSPEASQTALTEASSESVKARLKAVTQEALGIGAFGSPTFLVHTVDGRQEMVFGSDRFHVIADLLGLQYLGTLNHLSTHM